MRNQSPRSKEWKEYLDKGELGNLGHFEQEPNDTGSVPGNELVIHNSSVRGGYDYRHLANAYADMGLISNEPDTRAPKSILSKVSKTARDRLHQVIADEHQMDHMNSELGLSTEENLIRMGEEPESETEGPGHWPLSVFEEEGLIAAEIAQTREELEGWEDFANDMAKAEIQKKKGVEAEGLIDKKWAKADQTQETLEKRAPKYRSYNGHAPNEDQTRSKKDRRLTLRDKPNVELSSLEKTTNTLPFPVRRPIEDPWEKIADKYSIGGTVRGTVKRFSQFGMFIQLENDINGFIHSSEISDNSDYATIKSAKEGFRIGDEVEGTVIDIDRGKHLIDLSFRENRKKIAEVDSALVEENGEVQLFAQYAKNPKLIEEEVNRMGNGSIDWGGLEYLKINLDEIRERIPAQDKWALESVNHLIEEIDDRIAYFEYEKELNIDLLNNETDLIDYYNTSNWLQAPENTDETVEKHWVAEPEVETTATKPVANLAELTEKIIDKLAMDREIAEREERQYKVHAPTSGDRQSRAREINEIRRSGRKAA